METISVVVPCRNEEDTVKIFYEKFKETARKMKLPATYEIVFVDDGSDDSTLDIMRELSRNDSQVRYISFSRNFGKEAAMLAGLKTAKGDYAAVMDVDLQDPPYLLKEMYEKVSSGEYDCAAACRSTRDGEPKIRSALSNAFYSFINTLSDTEFVRGARDFRLMSRQMLDSVLSLEESSRFSKGIFSWVGYKTAWIAYENVERSAGSSKWGIWKLFMYSLEGITAFSTKPLAISSFLGIIFIIVALVLIVAVIIKTLIWGDPAAGYPSLVCIILLLSGLELFSLGIIGQYLSKTYIEVKKRPPYIIKEKSDNE